MDESLLLPLKLITEGSHEELVAWAEEHKMDKNILRLLKNGYQVTFKGASEYRGALVFTYQAIVEEFLKTHEASK
jgi:hypothetical protein